MTTKIAATIDRSLTLRSNRRRGSDGVEFAGREDLVAYLRQEVTADNGVRYTSKELRQNLSRDVGINL